MLRYNGRLHGLVHVLLAVVSNAEDRVYLLFLKAVLESMKEVRRGTDSAETDETLEQPAIEMP